MQMETKILIECVNGPMDGYSGFVVETEEPISDRVFLFQRRADGFNVTDAYAWTGRWSKKGMAMLGHVMEVGRGRKAEN